MAGTDDRLADAEAASETGQSSSFKDHLVNSLVTSSEHAGYVYDVLKAALDAQPREGRHHLKRLLMNALRKAITLRETHKQLAQLIRGEDLDTRDLRRTREAEIYKRIKAVQYSIASNNAMGAPIRDPQTIMLALQAIMDFIKEDNSVT